MVGACGQPLVHVTANANTRVSGSARHMTLPTALEQITTELNHRQKAVLIKSAMVSKQWKDLH